jgi:hypothetical protein
LASGDDAGAIETCESLLDIDPNDTVTRANYVGLLAATGQEEAAERELAGLDGAPRPVITMARQLVADAAYTRGDIEKARLAYEQLLEEPQTDDAARQIEVRLLGLEGGRRESELISDLLLGADGRATSAPVAVHLAQAISEVREDGLGAYLEARQLVFAGRYDLALPLMRKANEVGLPTERLRKEARKLLGMALYAEGEREESRQVWEAIDRDENSSQGERVMAQDWLRR